MVAGDSSDMGMTETDDYGINTTERVVAAYSDLERNREFVSRYWPYTNLDPNTKLLRFTTVENLRRMLQSRTNYLANVLTWPDVYEGLTRNIKLEDQNHNAIDWSSITTTFYGQCWTTTPFDSELLWNARCGKDAKNGVCIRTTLGRLICGFLRGVGMKLLSPDNVIARCGGVKYLNDVDFAVEFAHLVQSIQDSSGLVLTSPRMLDCLMIKRLSFSDENEVRLVVDGCAFQGLPSSYIRPNMYSFHSSGISYSVIPDDFITEVVVDPRIPEGEANAIIVQLQSELKNFGWTNNGVPIAVHRSDLYNANANVVTIAI